MKGSRRFLTSPPRAVSSTKYHSIRFTSTNNASSSTPTNTGQMAAPKTQGRTPYSSLSVASKSNPGSVEHDIFGDRSKRATYPNHKVNQDFSEGGKSVLAIRAFFHPSSPNLSHSDPMTPLRHYQNLMDKGVLREDNHQTRIIQILQDLHDKLVHYTPPEIPLTTESNSLVSNRIVFTFPHSTPGSF